MIENLVDVVEWILLVDNSVEENSKSPDVLFLTPVRLALEDFGSSVICLVVSQKLRREKI